jgi:transcriptional regulator
MYTPRSFRVEDRSVLHALIREHSFGILTSQDGGRPVATHRPFMLEPDRGGPNGTLIAHMARANPQWKSWTPETVVLAVFQGAHTYVSPGWYESQETVPTWNYAAVHVYGRPRLIHDPDELRPLVTRLMELHEAHAQSGWDPKLMEPVMAAELRAIVGFEIPIDAVGGKLKFNQNRSQADQRRVIERLEGSPDPLGRASADIMRRNLSG